MHQNGPAPRDRGPTLKHFSADSHGLVGGGGRLELRGSALERSCLLSKGSS